MATVTRSPQMETAHGSKPAYRVARPRGAVGGDGPARQRVRAVVINPAVARELSPDISAKCREACQQHQPATQR